VYRFDLATNTPLPDLVAWPGGPEYRQKWTTGVAYRADGTLLLLRGSFIDFVDGQGQTLRSLPLDEYGYAMLTAAADGRHVFVANIFTGVMAKVDLDTGAIVGRIDTGLAKPQRSLAGVAEYAGPN
jgi:outer membrane protein assembly factor BamB